MDILNIRTIGERKLGYRTLRHRTLRHWTLRHWTLRHWTLRHTFQNKVDATAHFYIFYNLGDSTAHTNYSKDITVRHITIVIQIMTRLLSVHQVVGYSNNLEVLGGITS